MTQTEIKTLKAGDKIGFQVAPGAEIVPATVKANGPRLDPEGKPLLFILDLLVVNIDNSSMIFSWEPDNFPDGIPNLSPETAIGTSVSP